MVAVSGADSPGVVVALVELDVVVPFVKIAASGDLGSSPSSAACFHQSKIKAQLVPITCVDNFFFFFEKLVLINYLLSNMYICMYQKFKINKT